MIENYRPIAILNNFSKLCEIVFHKVLSFKLKRLMRSIVSFPANLQYH